MVAVVVLFNPRPGMSVERDQDRTRACDLPDPV
jgi:hypothetical protein